MNGLSATEPSTPLRNPRDIGASGSLFPPSAARIDEIHLPPNELTAINLSFRNKQNSTPRRSNRRSRQGTITPTRSSRRLSSRMSLTPSRYSPLPGKRRRSSIIVENKGDTLFNPGYAGPVTLEYLKYLCQIALEEKEKGWVVPSTESVGLEDFARQTTEDHSEEHDGGHSEEHSEDSPYHAELNASNEIAVGDQSLLIPDNIDELLRSPDNVLEEPTNPFLVRDRAPKNNYSYLERILAAQSKQDRALELSAESPAVPQLQSETHETIESPILANQSFVFDDLNNELENSEEFHSNADQIIPEPAAMEYPGSSSEVAGSQFVQEEYFLDEEISDLRRNSLYSRPKSTASSLTPPRVRPTAKKRKHSTADLSVPSKMIKTMVSAVNFKSANSKHKDPHIKLTSEAMHIIRDQSESFLAQLMGDLEDYAEYRKSNTISIKDVMLYINRLRFPDKDGKRMETSSYFSSLARDYLPLESFLDLQNGLKTTFHSAEVHDTVHSKMNFVTDFSDDRSDYSDYDNDDDNDDYDYI